MRYRKLTADGDFTIGTGQDFYINSPDAVAQAVLTTLKLFTNEWFLDLGDGTPWRTQVLGKYTKDVFDTVVKQRILSAQGVNSILAYQSEVDGNTRRLAIQATINTIYGTSTVQGTL